MKFDTHLKSADDKTSLLLFKSFSSSGEFAISNFSARNSWHFFDARLNVGTVHIWKLKGRGLHFSGSRPLLTIMVEFLYRSWLKYLCNDFWMWSPTKQFIFWLWYLVLLCWLLLRWRRWRFRSDTFPASGSFPLWSSCMFFVAVAFFLAFE